jgi:hypothetical protein
MTAASRLAPALVLAAVVAVATAAGPGHQHDIRPPRGNRPSSAHATNDTSRDRPTQDVLTGLTWIRSADRLGHDR